MIVELISVLSILIGGSLLVRIGGIRGWGIPGLGFLMGLSLMLLIGYVQVVIAQQTNPLLNSALTFFIPMTCWLWYIKKGNNVSFSLVPAVLCLAATVIAVIELYGAGFLNITPDSYRYAQLGSLLENGKIDSAQPSLLLKRLLAVPLMHSPANIAEGFYLKSITPLLAFSTLCILAWYAQKGLQTKEVNIWTTFILPISAALLLVTNQFFVYNVFYVNGHILYAALLLLIAGSSWLYAYGTNVPHRSLLIIIYLSIPAFVVTRPESSLHALLAILPILVSKSFTQRQRVSILALVGISIIIWNAFLLGKFITSGVSAPLAVTGMLALGIATLLVTPFLFSNIFHRISNHILSFTEISIWLTLALAALINPETFTVSIRATFENIILNKGLWGYSLIVLAILFIGTLVFSKTPERIFLRFPITTFIPLGFLLAFLRDGAYRIGAFDSLNRMFLHIVPLTILFIVSSAATSHWGFSKKK